MKDKKKNLLRITATNDNPGTHLDLVPPPSQKLPTVSEPAKQRRRRNRNIE
jgi:hypothetical protein